MDEFLIELQAKLDEAKSKGNVNNDIRTLQRQLDKLKVQAEIDQDTISKLTKEIEKVINKKITISNIEVDTKSGAKAGQNYGKQFSKGIVEGLKDNESILNTFKKSLENIGMGSKEIDKVAERVKNLNLQIDSLTQSISSKKGNKSGKDILSVGIAGTDQMGQAIKLTEQYDKANGELLKSIDSVTTAQKKADDATDSFITKRKKAVASAKNNLSSIESKLNDPNINKSLAGTDFNTNGLTQQLDKVRNAISILNNASRDTFTQAQIDVDTEITSLNNLISTLKNAKYAATSLRTKGLETTKEVYSSKLDVLITKMKSSGTYTAGFENGTNNLKNILSNATDSSGLTAFLNGLDKLEAGYKRVEASAKAYNKERSIKIDKSGLQSKIADLQRICPEIDNFKAKIENADVSVKSLYNDIGKINTPDDFRLINKKFKAFTDAAKSAGIAVVEVSDKYDSLLRKIDGEITSYKYQNQSSKITDRYNKIDPSLIDESLKNDYKELINLSNELNISMGNDDKINAYNRLAELIPSIKNRLAELQSSQNQLNEINNIKDLVNGKTKNDYSTQIAKIGGNFRSIGFSQEDVDEKLKSANNAFDALRQRLSQPFDKNNYQEIISLNDKLQKELAESSNEYTKLQASTKGYVSIHQRLTKANTIEAWNQKNTKATKEAIATNQVYIDSLRNLNAQMTQMDYDEISIGFKRNENSMRGINRLGTSLKNQFTEASHGFSQWLSISSGIMFAISKTKDAILEIKNLDDILTEISKTSDLTSSQLKQLGMDAYDSASKYGRTASDFLLGVQEMARSGFYGEKGTGMAEQSLLAQASGDMNAELANNYVLATNAAYKLNGEAEKINAVLDGQNSITNKNSVAMADMATAMSEAGTVASSYRVSIEDLSAMIGTIESVTKLGGSEVGNAIKAILINLQNVTSDKMVDTLDAANASMTEMVNGAEKLRNPIDILRDLAKTFNQLDEDDPLRAEILTNVGQKYHAAKLGALLQNMDMFDKMLVDYSEGSGSALEEANKSANNLTGTLNKLSNSWNELVNSLINSDELKFGVSLLDSLVQGATKLVSVLTPLGTIGVGAGLFTGFKNTGKCRISVRIS